MRIGAGPQRSLARPFASVLELMEIVIVFDKRREAS